MKKFLIVLLSLINFNIFSQTYYRHNKSNCQCLNYNLYGNVCYEEIYKDFFVIYTKKINKNCIDYCVYFYKHNNLDGYIVFLNGTNDYFYDIKECIKKSFYNRNITSFKDYINQELNGKREGAGTFSKTDFIEYYDYSNIHFLYWGKLIEFINNDTKKISPKSIEEFKK